MNLLTEARNHTIQETTLLGQAVSNLHSVQANSDADFAKKLGDLLIACNVFISSTKHQHRTMCDTLKGIRA